ncbi:hypothetical protein HPB48_021756 [Haemaphysalis longicornis]|uniref:Uncharacterized protein n=1 Tax=Haemaphysalis longicornis TaxID=44386 RepID=A0A9J6FU93_HAELO|nr:hypothetical protein HPB48_021756 [Haemaphysalis longicornis]
MATSFLRLAVKSKKNKTATAISGALAEVDAVIYADSDVLFLSPLEDLWHFFETMNDSQLAAMAPNRETTAPTATARVPSTHSTNRSVSVLTKVQA